MARSKVYFYSCLPLGLTSVLFPYVFLTKAPHTSFLSLICATYLAYHILIYLITLIPCVIKIVKLLCTLSSPFPLLPLSSRPNYLSQHLIHEHLQPMFLPQCERPRFTPIQNINKIVVLYVKICIFLCSKLGQKRLNPLKTKRRQLYLKPQSVPRCKHFSSRL